MIAVGSVIFQSVFSLLALSYVENMFGPWYIAVSSAYQRVSIIKDESLLKSRNTWDQICAPHIL